MALMTTGFVGSFQLFVSLSTIMCDVGFKNIHLKVRQGRVSLNESLNNETTRRLVECVYSCIQHTDCRSLGYNKTSGNCHLFKPQSNNIEKRSDTLLLGNLKEALSGKAKKLDHPTTKPATQQLRYVLQRGKMTWHKAKHGCGRLHMAKIKNEIDQVRVVEICQDSGLEYVAIGAYRDGLTWVTKGGFDRLLYHDWSDGEPAFTDSFAGLSKRKGYRWEGLPFYQLFDGVLCECLSNITC